MKDFFKKTVNWLGLTSNKSEVIDTCMSFATILLIFAMILVTGKDIKFAGFYLDGVVLILSILFGLGILYSIYRLIWDERYVNKKFSPIAGIIFYIILLTITWTFLKPESDRLREMERKWKIENVCMEDD